jgi:hypothetical protein
VRLASEKLPEDEPALSLLDPGLKLVETPEPGARRILLKENRKVAKHWMRKQGIVA